MGLLSFLSSLVNGDDEEAGGGSAPHKFGYDADGYLVPQMNKPIPESVAPHSSDDIVVKGDSWKPKKNTVLGAIADAISYYSDGTTPFKDERDKANMESASKGLMNHPEEAIGRLAQINPEFAWKQRGQVTDDKRMQGGLDRQNQLLEFQKQKHVYSQLANMMGVAVKRKNPANWTQMRQQALNYANQYGIDASGIIPENYDEDAIDTITLGSVPVAKQMQLDETKQYHGDTMDYRNRNLEERSRYHQGQLGLGEQRVGVQAKNSDETARHNTETEATAKQNANQSPHAARRTIQTKYGPAVISPDGARAILSHGGKNYGYTIVNGTMVPTGEIKKKGK